MTSKRRLGGSLPPHEHNDPHLDNSRVSGDSFEKQPGLVTVDPYLAYKSQGHADEECLGCGDRTSCPEEHPIRCSDLERPSLHNSSDWSYLKWCVNLVPLVLRSRTPLACFVAKTISLSKTFSTREGLASTFFPVPIPFFDVFGRTPRSSSASSRHSYHISRAIHVVVMTLNFWHFGGSWCDLELLRREPSCQHLCLFKRLRFLIKSDWPAKIPDLPKAGRKFPQLIARLSELSECLTRIGPSANPYERQFSGCDVPADNSVLPELSPYRDLDPDRLRIKGSGKWDATPFLGDGLCMIYRDPACIKFTDVPSVVPANRDSPETVGKLARLWDTRGLLFLHDKPVGSSSHVRIFNTLKSATQDRQIGDRRALNSQEARIYGGPSSDLPAGCDITSLVINPKHQSIAISITDRSDFYHQFLSTPSRAVANTVPPCVPISLLSGTTAMDVFLSSRKKNKGRERTGDHLDANTPTSLLVPDPGHLWVSFNSILQGDHSGVEIATESHSNLLGSWGLLHPTCRLVASSPLKSFEEAQGLVIDDFFALSIQDKHTPPEETLSAAAYRRAQSAYNSHGLEGSPEKDIVAQPEGKVIGAYINGGRRATSRGMVLVGAPIEKRLGLSVLSLFVSQLAYTSDSLHLCLIGGWTSVLGYRRPLMSVLQSAYHVVDMTSFDANRPKLVPLTREVATELVTLAVLMPLATSDIAAPISNKLFCTDASLKKGAILETTLDEKVMNVLYRATINKGSYTRLLSPASAVLKTHDWTFEESDEDGEGDANESPERPWAFFYEFIEVYAGSSKITKVLNSLGVVCGPALDLSLSEEFDLRFAHAISWLTFMVTNKRLRAYALEPPCTTFSIMRRPRLRSRQRPLGFKPRESKTELGNILANRSGQLMYIGARHNAIGLLETPYSSYMKHMPFWRTLETYDVFKTVRCDSCRYGSPHLKSFRFLCLNLDTSLISDRCVCTTRHIQIEGSLTKSSAIYTDQLADSIGRSFFNALRKPASDDVAEKSPFGLESLLVNEVMESAEWTTNAVWQFKKESHINILEESALLRLCSKIARTGKTVRTIVITDSNVVKCATSKGRTSSRGLGPILRRLCSLLVSAGIYLNVAYIPTRLNAADDPTRDSEVRKPVPGLLLENWCHDDLFKLSSLGRFRRWTSNWLRLCILLRGPSFLYIGDRSLHPYPWIPRKKPLLPAHALRHDILDFDSSLGFPGEGPVSSYGWIFLLFDLLASSFLPLLLSFVGLLTWTSFCFACWWWGVVLCRRCPLCLLSALLWAAPGAHGMPVFPTTPGDFQRASQRQARPALTEGRTVEPKTIRLRERLLELFGGWLCEQGVSLDGIFAQGIHAADDLNVLLCRYGRQLYQSGKTYNTFAETINAVTAKKPVLRRSLQGAWDLGYAWVKAEPSQHHVAMPAPILCAMVSLATMWGWLQLAGSLALCWGALLRPGELICACRRDLLLPSDLAGTIRFAILSIHEPKSRHTTARHQAAKLDAPDLVAFVDFVFRDLEGHQRLWPHTASTLRTRFGQLLKALHLPTTHQPSLRCLDLGSLRSGGATWLMLMTENPDLCRRRGRWASHRMMEIYVQECMALQYIKHISPESRAICIELYKSFSDVVFKAGELYRAKIPLKAWFVLFSS